MTELTSTAKTPLKPQEPRKIQRRIALLAGVILLAVLLVLKPPFVIRPLPGRGQAGSQPAQSTAAKFVDPIWATKVLPTIQEEAQDIAKILPEIRADPNNAGQKYGRREDTNPYNYMVKGSGKVTQLHTESQAGTATIEIPGLGEKVALQIGPVVRGTALRDATEAVSFNQFTNQLDYADVSKEMNARALKAAFANVAPNSIAGKTLTFFGAFTFDPHSKSPILVTPVKIDL
jgi:predicted lipoprotein